MTTTSIKSVFPYLSIPNNNYNNDQVEEWIMSALHMIGVKLFGKQEVMMLSFKNNSVMLPSEVNHIELIAISEESNVSINDVLPTSFDTKTVTYNESTNEVTTTTTTTTTAIQGISNASHKKRITSQGYINEYNIFAPDSEFHNMFEIPRITNKPFTSQFCSKNCPNLESNYHHYVNISPDGVIYTDVHSGTFCIAYLAPARSEDGEFLMPNRDMLKQALSAYCMMRYWENQVGETNSQVSWRMYSNYQAQWNIALARERGTHILLTTDKDALISIQENLIRIVENGSFPYLNGWYRGYKNNR